MTETCAPFGLYAEILRKLNNTGDPFIGTLVFNPEDLNMIISGLTYDQTLNVMSGSFLGIGYETSEYIARSKVAVKFGDEVAAIWDLWGGCGA